MKENLPLYRPPVVVPPRLVPVVAPPRSVPKVAPPQSFPVAVAEPVEPPAAEPLEPTVGVAPPPPVPVVAPAPPLPAAVSAEEAPVVAPPPPSLPTPFLETASVAAVLEPEPLVEAAPSSPLASLPVKEESSEEPSGEPLSVSLAELPEESAEESAVDLSSTPLAEEVVAEELIKEEAVEPVAVVEERIVASPPVVEVPAAAEAVTEERVQPSQTVLDGESQQQEAPAPVPPTVAEATMIAFEEPVFTAPLPKIEEPVVREEPLVAVAKEPVVSEESVVAESDLVPKRENPAPPLTILQKYLLEQEKLRLLMSRADGLDKQEDGESPAPPEPVAPPSPDRETRETSVVPAPPEGPPMEPRWRILRLSGTYLVPFPDVMAGRQTLTSLRDEETPESFFHLYATLERLAARQTVLGVTSAVGGEGVTTVALHLALSIARSTYNRVCLVDLSLGEDTLCRRVGAAPAPRGLMDCLEDERALAALDWPGPESLTLFPAGRKPLNAARTARAPRTADLIAALRAAYDIVIVDLPSIASDNAVPLAQHLDGVILVARAGATPRTLMREAIATLGPGTVAGVVLNRVTSARRQKRPSGRAKQ